MLQKICSWHFEEILIQHKKCSHSLKRHVIKRLVDVYLRKSMHLKKCSKTCIQKCPTCTKKVSRVYKTMQCILRKVDMVTYNIFLIHSRCIRSCICTYTHIYECTHVCIPTYMSTPSQD